MKYSITSYLIKAMHAVNSNDGLGRSVSRTSQSIIVGMIT